jgi:hypothetical protein
MNGNQADELLAALKDDIEWPAASLRLIYNHLEPLEVGAFYWTVLAPDIVKSGREEQGSVSV